MHYDNGGEHELNKFEKFFVENVIHMENTIKRQHNGMAWFLMDMLGVWDYMLDCQKCFRLMQSTAARLINRVPFGFFGQRQY